MTKFSLWTERVSVSLPGSMPKFPARSLALFLPERYSAPGERGIALFSQPCLVPKFAFQTGRNCALPVPGRSVKIPGTQPYLVPTRALYQNSRRAVLLRSYPGAMLKPPASVALHCSLSLSPCPGLPFKRGATASLRSRALCQGLSYRGDTALVGAACLRQEALRGI